MMSILRAALTALTMSGAAFAVPAYAACLSDDEVAKLAAAFEARQPAPTPEGLSSADGECTRAKFNKLLQARMGAPIGYKAGLTNPAVQKRFNHDSPVRGTLYKPMLLENGATVEAAFGARPVFEADLLVRISDAAVNQAKTPQQVQAAIDQVIPFIELPDLMVAAPPKLNGAAINAINVGARLGVTGTPLPVPRNPAFADSLRDMLVVVRGDGAEIDRGKGSDVLEHPLNAVIWLAQDLAREGLALKPGDLVSLGSFSRPLPPKAGQAIEVEYVGLPGNPRVGLSFR